MQLTTKEKDRIIAMYFGQRVLKFSPTAPATQEVNAYFMCRLNEDCRLALTPLSAISDEHLIEFGTCIDSEPKFLKELKENLEEGREFLVAVFNGSMTKNDIAENNIPPINIFNAYQYLILQGYAVPLFFGLNHWANGKTAIELGVAVDKTTLK